MFASKRISKSILLGLMLSALITGQIMIRSPAHANPTEVAATPIGNLAIGGFDALTFTNNAGPQLGLDEHRYFWKGANWQFTSAANREAFRADPERFAPAYGGHGAWAVSVGEFLRGDPRLYLLIDDQVFLFYSESTLAKWLANPEELKRRADREWAEMLPDMK